MDTLETSEDSDETQHNAAFHQGLHCLLMFITTFSDKYTSTSFRTFYM